MGTHQYTQAQSTHSYSACHFFEVFHLKLYSVGVKRVKGNGKSNMNRTKSKFSRQCEKAYREYEQIIVEALHNEKKKKKMGTKPGEKNGKKFYINLVL